MATMTISIDSEAFRRLRKARKHPRESFSQVIHRGHWEEGATAQSWVENFDEVPPVEESIIEELEGIPRKLKAISSDCRSSIC